MLTLTSTKTIWFHFKAGKSL